MNTISYYGQPIKTMMHNGIKVEYCLWKNGIRLVEVNGFKSELFNNCIFSHYVELVLNHEGITQ
jgi:hypothetical protein